MKLRCQIFIKDYEHKFDQCILSERFWQLSHKNLQFYHPVKAYLWVEQNCHKDFLKCISTACLVQNLLNSSLLYFLPDRMYFLFLLANVSRLRKRTSFLNFTSLSECRSNISKNLSIFITHILMFNWNSYRFSLSETMLPISQMAFYFKDFSRRLDLVGVLRN